MVLTFEFIFFLIDENLIKSKTNSINNLTASKRWTLLVQELSEWITLFFNSDGGLSQFKGFHEQ